jgi:hypothetical protein
MLCKKLQPNLSEMAHSVHLTRAAWWTYDIDRTRLQYVGCDQLALLKNGDAIPTHLLTREAIQLYLGKLADDGILALHITNNYVDLRAVLAAQANAAGLVARVQDDGQPSEEEARRGKAPSTWVVMARREKALAGLASDRRWKALSGKERVYFWTDDYSNIFQVLGWQ